MAVARCNFTITWSLAIKFNLARVDFILKKSRACSPSLLSKTGWGITAPRRQRTTRNCTTQLRGHTHYARRPVGRLQGMARDHGNISVRSTSRILQYYKAIAAFERTPEDGDPPRDSDRIFEVLANMTDAALQTGFVFERWRKRVNAMIKKIPGSPRLDKLRVIHLLEADLNLALGIIWSRRLMTQSEKVGAFGDEQWGSRKGRSANTVVLLKHFTYEHQTGG
jgi:hypothetical protein